MPGARPLLAGVNEEAATAGGAAWPRLRKGGISRRELGETRKQAAQSQAELSAAPPPPFNYWAPLPDDDPKSPLLPRNPTKEKIRIITPDELANGQYHMDGLEEEVKRQTEIRDGLREARDEPASKDGGKEARDIIGGGGATGGRKKIITGRTGTIKHTRLHTESDGRRVHLDPAGGSELIRTTSDQHVTASDADASALRSLRAKFKAALAEHWSRGDLNQMAGVAEEVAKDPAADDNTRFEAHLYAGVSLCTGAEPGAAQGPVTSLSWVNLFWSGAQGYLCRCREEFYSKAHCEDQQRRAEDHARAAIKAKPTDSAAWYLLAKIKGGPIDWPSRDFWTSLDAYNRAIELGNGYMLKPDLMSYPGAYRGAAAQLLGAESWGHDDRIHNMTYLRASMAAWHHDPNFMDIIRRNEGNGVPVITEDGQPAHGKFRVIRSAIPRELALAGYHYFMGLYEDNMVHYDAYDSLVYDRTAFMFYSNPFSESLAEYVRPQVEKAFGKKLVHAYSAGRVYLKGTDLKMHSDRPAAQYSMTLTLGYPDEDPGWPLYIESHDKGKSVTMANLEPGDAMAYMGVTCEHWRGMLRSKNHVQVFLHFVDADGPFQTSFFEGLHVGSYMVNVFGQKWGGDGVQYADPGAWRRARERWCRGDKVGSLEDFAHIGVSRGEGTLMNDLWADPSPQSQASYKLIMDLANGRRYATDDVYKKIASNKELTWVEKGDAMLEWLGREFHDLGVKHHNASLLDAATTIIERREVWNRCNGELSAFDENCCWH
jgi:hypothetical protein